MVQGLATRVRSTRGSGAMDGAKFNKSVCTNPLGMRCSPPSLLRHSRSICGDCKAYCHALSALSASCWRDGRPSSALWAGVH